MLGTQDLKAEDVAELLWDSQGCISHLEIFNMKGWMEGRQAHLKEISELQQALNAGLGPRVKELIRRMARRMDNQDEVRAAKFRQILLNVPKLWAHYRDRPLGSRLGTNSTSRAAYYGMGFALKETLPRRSVRARARERFQPDIPICSPVEECVRYRRPSIPRSGRARKPACAGCRAAATWVWSAAAPGRRPARASASAHKAML